MFNRTVGNYDPDEVSAQTSLLCEDPSLAVQSQKDDTDINVIVRNFGVTGNLPQSLRVATYDDFTGVSDYRSAIHAVREAEASFMALSWEVRERFGNNPQAFVEFCSDGRNLDEMRKLGLAPAAPVDVPPEPLVS